MSTGIFREDFDIGNVVLNDVKSDDTRNTPASDIQSSTPEDKEFSKDEKEKEDDSGLKINPPGTDKDSGSSDNKTEKSGTVVSSD